MCGPRPLATVAEVREYWATVPLLTGWEFWKSRPPETMFDPALVWRTDVDLPAYVNGGRWVVDCLCGGGAAAWPENRNACCLDCGTVWIVVFPEEREEAEEVLALRPLENRNWRPQSGETIGYLALQNAENGLPVPECVRGAAEAAGLADVLRERAGKIERGDVSRTKNESRRP